MLWPSFAARLGSEDKMVVGRAAFFAVSTVAAAFVAVAAGPSHSGADFVSPGCRAAVHARACGVAVQYLAALDLDRADDACGLLDPGTLEAAGGLGACKRALLLARGTRIHYRVSAVAQSPLGTTVRFSTRADGRQWLRQRMLVSHAGRIIAIVFERW
jgi:hypothetical protein